MNNPLLSIIVPVYKVEKFLGDCITSIINQKFCDFEVILVDDGSPDNCPRLCDEWAAKDKRIKVIHKANGGLSDARNCGIDAATGDYVWFVDSDDVITPNALINISEFIKTNNAVDAVACQIIESKDGQNRVLGNLSVWESGQSVISNAEYVDGVVSILPSVRYIVKRNIYTDNDLRFIVGVLHEDIPFCHMLINFTKSIGLLQEPVYVYRIRGGSITTTSNIESCYSLVKSLKKINEFIDTNVSVKDQSWFLNMIYDYFYEIFLRIYPFINKPEYKLFMSKNGLYLKKEFAKIRPHLKGKRKILSYLFNLSPKFYSRLIYFKRN